MNKKVLIITNNQSVYDAYKASFNIKLIEEGYYEVLKEARNLVHQGYELITHPLMGSVKPNETPYRSIILKYSGKTDFQSVDIIEISIEAYEKFQRSKPSPSWSEKVLEDFKFVDLKLLESSLDNITLYT